MAIELKKGGDRHRIDLTKGGSANQVKGEIVINLDWSKGNSGFFGMFKKPIDLDLGCFVEMRDGGLWCIDGLQFAHNQGGPRDRQTRQGCYTLNPYVWHNGDDRDGSAMSGENISVNPAKINEIKRMLIYTFIYDGAARWSDTDAVVKVVVPGIDTIEVKMDQQESNKRFCAIAALDFGGDNSITVTKLVTFFDGHPDCAQAYGWPFKFTPGTK